MAMRIFYNSRYVCSIERILHRTFTALIVSTVLIIVATNPVFSVENCSRLCKKPDVDNPSWVEFLQIIKEQK